MTGGAGFIGSHLCDRLLAEGKRVVAVDDLSTGRIANLAEARRYGPQFTFHTIDVRSEGLRPLFDRHRPEVVMHLAAQPSVPASLRDPIRDAAVNVMGLLNVLEAAAATGVRKLVFAAGAGVYGEPRKLPVRETSLAAGRPMSPHAVAKRVALHYLGYYRRERGVDHTALLLATVYGPRQVPIGDGPVVASFLSSMLAGQVPTILGDGTQTRDFLFVDDAVHAFALAADEGSGAVLNVGTGVETSVTRLYELAAQATGFDGEPRFGAARSRGAGRMVLDPALSARTLGWRPWTVLEDGLAATVDWLRGM